MATDCNLYLDWHTGSDGNMITGAIAAGSCRPTNPTDPPEVYPSTLHMMKIETDSASPVSGLVVAGGVEYDIGDTIQGAIYDHSQNYEDMVTADMSSPPNVMSMGFLFKTTLNDPWKRHALSGLVGSGEWALLSKWADGSGNAFLVLETSQGYFTGGGDGIAIAQNTWYWITIQYNRTAKKGYLAVYLASTMAQVGSTIEGNFNASPSAVSYWTVGQHASQGNVDVANSWYGPVIFDWTDGTFPLLPEVSVAYALAVDPGSYALSGQAVGTLAGRKVAADAGGYALSGQDAALFRAARIGADGGTYVLSGLAADLLFDRLISLGAGSYVLTGQDVSLVYISGYSLVAEAGSYSLAGQAAALLKANRLPLEAGAYVLTGQDAGALLGRLLAAEKGSHVIVGQAATLLRDGRLAVEAGGVVLIGADSSLIYSGGAAVIGAIVKDIVRPDRIAEVRRPDRIAEVRARRLH